METEAATPGSEAPTITDALRQHYPPPEPTEAQRKEQELHEAVAEVGRRRAARAEAAERAPKVTIEGEQLEPYLARDPKPEPVSVRQAAANRHSLR